MIKTQQISVGRKIINIWKYFITPSTWKTWYVKGMQGPSPNWQKGGVVIWEDGLTSGISEFLENETLQFKNKNNSERWFFTTESENVTRIRFEVESDRFLDDFDEMADELLSKLTLALELNILKPEPVQQPPSLPKSNTVTQDPTSVNHKQKPATTPEEKTKPPQPLGTPCPRCHVEHSDFICNECGYYKKGDLFKIIAVCLVALGFGISGILNLVNQDEISLWKVLLKVICGNLFGLMVFIIIPETLKRAKKYQAWKDQHELALSKLLDFYDHKSRVSLEEAAIYMNRSTKWVVAMLEELKSRLQIRINNGEVEVVHPEYWETK